MRNPFEVYTSLHKEKSGRSLDWEESALDSQKKVEEGLFDESRQVPKLHWLLLLLIASFFILAFRLVDLQIIRGASFRTLSEDNRIRSKTVLAPRGLIKDRNGKVLAQNTASFDIVAVPFDLPKTNLDSELAELSRSFELDLEEVKKKVSSMNPRSLEPVIIAQGISQEQSILFQTRAEDFYGFVVQQIPIRQYPDPEIFSHILGYTGLISPEQATKVDKDIYDTNDFIGKLGIESGYEKFLHGTNGQNLVEVDATGKVQNVLGQSSPLPGNTLMLNIDQELQQKLYHELSDKNPGRKAAAIALDPRNGQVLALVSVPGFNNNLFARGISHKEYQELLSDKTLPLFNRAISGTYPPGSTVKPMVAIAGLESGIINENTVVNDRGVLVIPNQYDPSVSYDFRGWKPGGLGPVNVRSAIALSSDIFFYEVAGGYPHSTIPGGLGAESLASWYRKFHLGQQMGVDIQGEASGSVPDPDWKAKYYKDNAILSKWYLGDTYHVGIGQGDLLVTPLQVALWTATIANNGTAYKPQIASRVIDDHGKIIYESKPEVLVSGVASAKNLKIVQEGMRQTVLAGTAKPLQSLPITSAGKTGTSQFDGADPSRTHAWFTAYAPYEEPQIVITVLVEAGGEGNAIAEPVVKDALQWWAENRYNRNNDY